MNNRVKTPLTEHFTLEEFTKSASHPEIKNVPNATQKENIIRVAEWLEILRARYNELYPREDGKETPIIINSGFRSKMLNYAVGGSPTSNHLEGCAVDIKCQDCEQAVKFITILLQEFKKRNGARFDELFIEKLGVRFWVHFAVRKDKNRCKVSCYTAD